MIDREIERRLTTVVTLRQQEVLHYFASESDNLNLIATRVLINALLLRHNAGDTLGSSDVQVRVRIVCILGRNVYESPARRSSGLSAELVRYDLSALQ